MGRGLNKFSSLYRQILVNRFGEARSKTQRAKVGGPKGREWGRGSPPARGSGRAL